MERNTLGLGRLGSMGFSVCWEHKKGRSVCFQLWPSVEGMRFGVQLVGGPDDSIRMHKPHLPDKCLPRFCHTPGNQTVA